MSYVSQVVKMLGVEFGEKFEINENKNWICSFTDKQFEVSNKNKTYVNANLGEHVLSCLITGTYTVKRKPWKPKDEDDDFWYVDADRAVCRFSHFCSKDADYMNYYKLGNCYRTKEEAEANLDKWVAFYASDEVLEV